MKAIIVDDEKIARLSLKAALHKYCPEVEVLGLAESSKVAKEMIAQHHPDVVFLDIQMPGEDGFDFVNSLTNKDFLIVFVTAFNQYAIKAIKVSAFDYLLKPVDENELKETVQKLHEQLNTHKKDDIYRHLNNKINLQFLLRNLFLARNIHKLTIPHSRGYKVVNMDEILFFEGNNNYSNVHLSDETIFLSTRTLKEFEKTLDNQLFFRVHKSYLINLFHLKELISKEGGYIIMTNGKEIPVARGKSSVLLQKINIFDKKKK